MNHEHEQLTYQLAMEELEAMVKEMEQGDIPVDDLSEKVKRAAFLVNVCKKRLKSTEDEVKGILEGMTVEETMKSAGNGEENRDLFE